MIRKMVALAWDNGFAWGVTEASLLWIALGLTLLTLYMATRKTR